MLMLSKYLQKPKLTKEHKKLRKEVCQKWLTDQYDWKNIIFSDEKKFNLDGPDGFQYYWHDLRTEKKYLSKRKFGGGSLMIWAAFGFKGKSNLIIINGRLNSSGYCQLLNDYLKPIARRIGGKNWVFQHDRASIHNSVQTKTWLTNNNIRCLEWPAISPDLNPIENLWGILSRRVYADGRQFRSIKELTNVLIDVWDSITIEELNNLSNSMPKRCVDFSIKVANKIQIT